MCENEKVNVSECSVYRIVKERTAHKIKQNKGGHTMTLFERQQLIAAQTV